MFAAAFGDGASIGLKEEKELLTRLPSLAIPRLNLAPRKRRSTLSFEIDGSIDQGFFSELYFEALQSSPN
jgi:hypothetical protein